MPTTPPPTDEEYLRLLRDLKQKLRHADNLNDRFGDERIISDTRKIEEEIAKIPARIHAADEAENKLALLTCAAEDYLIARAAQFLPDVTDLWTAAQAMLERRDKPETPAEKPVVQLMDDLQRLGVSEAHIKAAVLAAAALESYKSPLASRRYSGARRNNPARDYGIVLKQQVTAFLKKDALKIESGAVLVALVNSWRREPESADSFWVRFYSQSILSAIAVLHKLDTTDVEIARLIEEAYGKWSAKRG